MSKTPLVVMAGLVIALAIGLSWELSARAVDHAALDRDIAQQEIRRDKIARLSTRTAAAQQTLASLPPISVASAPDPIQLERKRLDVIVRKGELDGTYAGLFRRLKLDHATVDALKALIVARNQAVYDAQQVAKEENLTLASDAEEQELERAATREADGQIEALLGSEKFSEFDRYTSTLRIRNQLLWGTGMSARDSAGEERMDVLVTLFDENASDYFEQLFQNQAVPPLPEAFLTKAKPLLPEDAFDRLISFDREAAAWNRMGEISREAAYQGKLKLSKSSARIYNPPPIDAGAKSTPKKTEP